MTQVTTARILARRATLAECGQECVDWAISILEQGHDGHYLRLLIGMSPPFNHFEVAGYRDGLLTELGLANISTDDGVSRYSAEVLQETLTGKRCLIEALHEVSDLCISTQYQHDIFDFYLLYWAWMDLKEDTFQWYWRGANRENIDSIIRDRMQAYLDARKASGKLGNTDW